MPVRVDSNAIGLLGYPCFDSDVLSELKDISEDLMTSDIADIDCLSASEDIWKEFDDFLLTPPQSPPIKLDLVSDLLDMTSGDSIGFSDSSILHNADVLHDCMWSGQCAEDAANAFFSHSAGNCPAQTSRMCGRNRSDTPINTLSTSPFAIHSSFNDLLSTMSDTSSNEDDDSQSSMDDEDSGADSSQSSTGSTSFAKVKESLINDHSYGGSTNVISHQKDTKQKNSCQMQSLIYPKHSGYKIKCHKINGKKIKIIKANSPSIGCSTTSKIKSEEKSESLVVPTVRIIRNDKHLVKAKNQCIDSKQKESIQKDCKFSTRRKSSTVNSERKVMLAQNQFLKSKPTAEEVVVCDKGSKVPPIKRREHNDSERKRRDHLRNAFVGLRDQIPKLKSSEKRPPRILILHEATNYVHQLKEKQKYLESTYNAEMEKREKLLKILSQEKSSPNNY